MLGLIGASLGGLAKKLLKDQAKKIGKAVYERTLKPIIGKLRDRALELTRRVLRNPEDVDLERNLTEVQEDIQTLERAEAKLPVESLEQSREPTSVVAEEAQGTGRQSGRVKESYAMKRTQPPKIGDALQAIGGITEESVFGVELAPIKEKLKPTFAPDVPRVAADPGCARDPGGEPAGGTAVQLWQAAARGRRRHPGGDAVYSAGQEALAGRPDGA